MPTTLGKPYEIDWRGKPPHMLRQDIPVWYRFLDKWGGIFVNLYYDVLLGGPVLTPEQRADPLHRMWSVNTSKRADAVAELPDSVWLIEVTDTPKPQALGQLLMYRYLWLEDPKIVKPVQMVLVCEVVDTDLLAATASMGVKIYVMPLEH